jgi:importin subunit beta-1
MSEVFKCCMYEEESEVRVAAVQCLVEVVSHFYPFIEEFITRIKEVTLKILKLDPEENVKKQAIEVWNSLSDEEFY